MARGAALLLAASAAAQNGPGSGAWETATPESQGLDSAELAEAERRVNAHFRDQRVCYLVVKNGYIVRESYFNGHTQSSIRSAASVTKSVCSTLFGIGVHQGWANVTDLVREKVGDTRRCNADATLRNVLTMTGQSSDISNPQFYYDALGGTCFNTLVDYIAENNPDGLSMNEWKNRYFHEVLGMEHMSWTGTNCATGSSLSCRDMARVGQLWLNRGQWPGAGQVAGSEYIVDGSEWVFPNSGMDYGYGTWLHAGDPVDDTAVTFSGAGAQCVIHSKRHETMIISMGGGALRRPTCQPVWDESKHHVIPGHRLHPHHNSTPSAAMLAAREEAMGQ